MGARGGEEVAGEERTVAGRVSRPHLPATVPPAITTAGLADASSNSNELVLPDNPLRSEALTVCPTFTVTLGPAPHGLSRALMTSPYCR